MRTQCQVVSQWLGSRSCVGFLFEQHTAAGWVAAGHVQGCCQSSTLLLAEAATPLAAGWKQQLALRITTVGGAVFSCCCLRCGDAAWRMMRHSRFGAEVQVGAVVGGAGVMMPAGGE
jgi:hypothetical protein